MKIIKIESKDNEKIKTLKKLGVKKYRNKLNKFLVENLTIVYDALKNGNQPESLFITKSFFDNKSLKMQFILDNINIESIFLISEEVNKSFSKLKTPSGIVAIYIKEKEVKLSLDKEILYLNGINNPGNLGTILRSAVAFGINEVVIDESCADLYNSKTIQSAKDAPFKLNIVFDKKQKILKEINEKMDIFITAIDGGKDASGLFKNKNKFCVVFGSESHGVNEAVRRISNKVVNIRSNSDMESLNVAVSAGIILYEIYNKR